MLEGLRFIPRDQIDDEPDKSRRKGKRKSERRKERHERRRKHSRNDSSDDDGLERIKSKPRKKKKWYSSEEELSSSLESSSESESDHRRKKSKRSHDDSDNEHTDRKKKKKKKITQDDYPSEDEFHSGSENDNKIQKYRSGQNATDNPREKLIDVEGSQSQYSNNIVRKEMGLDWMLHPNRSMEKISVQSSQDEPKEASPETTKKKDNPRELNPYLKDNGSGYPEETDLMKDEKRRLLSSSVVGDGGASWRLKALKRAQEQAAREGKNFQNVVEERWGSMGDFAASVASQKVAPTYAHLHSINNRKKGPIDEGEIVGTEKGIGLKSTRSDLPRSQEMRVPKVDHSLSWRKSGRQNLSAKDSAVLSAAMSNLNKFSDDGNFMDNFMRKEDNSDNTSKATTSSAIVDTREFATRGNADNLGQLELTLSANQLAAKAMQLRMKGKHEEAEKLMRGVENMKGKHDIKSESRKPRVDATTSSLIMHDVSTRQKKKEDDADLHLAQKILHNHRYSTSNQADEEYDYDGSPRKKGSKKGGGNHRSSEITNSANRFMTQQDRCPFCFENPARPKHLVIAIGNFTYLSLPQHQPVVPGHCCILTLQHENSTRNLDDNVWEEIRNFKKCLIMMYAKQEKDVLFMETVVQLSRQRRHCLVECIPLPQDIAKQAPLYFKKAIDEAEEEWSQHNAKKLIDTNEKGLRGSIPKNFPYFHVEFGLKKGFVHVIDDESEFKTSFGLNVVRGMVQLPVEDMHRRRRHESFESQKQGVASFLRDWEPFDWTKQLE